MYKKPSLLIIFVLVMISVLLTSCLSTPHRPMLPGPRFVTLVEEGRSNVVIIIPRKATTSDSEVAAASDLEEYLEEVTGADITTTREEPESLDQPIAPFPRKIPVYVGNCEASRHLKDTVNGLVNDGYVIEIGEDSLHLLGKNGLATRFAVYGFLEDYIDIHWFLPEVFGRCCFPEHMGTSIPKKDTLTLKTGLDVQDPSFKYRKIGKPDNLWTIRNRMNFTHDDDQGYRINRNVHSFHVFVNPDTEGVDRDFFAQVNGERRDICEFGTWPNERLKLNVGNPNVEDVMAQEIIRYIDEHPEIDIINIFPNDGRCFDESLASKDMDGANLMHYTVEDVNNEGRKLEEEYGRVLSKRYTMFYHDVTDAVLAERPDKLLMTGAYSPYQYAPLEVDNSHEAYDPCFISGNRMDDNVMLLITHSWEHNHPIEDRSTTPNQYFDDSIEGWKKLYSKLGVYEYYRKLAMNELPFPIIHSIRDDIPYYHRNGFCYFYTQYNLDDIGTYGLNYYIATKLLWNVNADVDRIMGDFYDKFYGPASSDMMDYFETLEQAAIESNLELSPEYYGAFLDLFTDRVLDECDGHLRNAEAAVAGNELLDARVHLSRISLDYTRQITDYLKGIRDAMQNRPFWDIQKVSIYPQEYHDRVVRAIKQYIEDMSEWKTITEAKYTDRLFKRGNAFKSVRSYYYGEGDEYTKETWLEHSGIALAPGYGSHEFFDIWIYAHDVDYWSGHGEEHQISLVMSSGDVIELGRIAGCQLGGGCTNERGNNVDKGFLLQNFSFAELLDGDDQVTIEVLNYPGGRGPGGLEPTESTFYGIAIMPHNEVTTQEDVTGYYNTNINYIREHSLGFTEFAHRQLNEDGETLCLTVPLYH